MRLLIRADGDRRIGVGHVMRCLALAEVVQARAGGAILAGAALDTALADRVRREGVTVLERNVEPGSPADAEWLRRTAGHLDADWMVVDGYRFGEEYLTLLQAAGRPILVVDDYAAAASYPVQIVLNQNVAAEPAHYPPGGADTRYLLGPAYALLRNQFSARAAVKRVPAGRARRFLVTLGGADPDNATARVLEGVCRLPDPDIEVRVVIGPSNPHGAALRSRDADPRIEFLAPQEEMAPLMEWAELAITGAGGTVYELACLSVPTLVVAIADYQRGLSEALARAGIAENLGWHEALRPEALAHRLAEIQGDPGRRAAMGRQGRARVDGQGASRVVDAMKMLSPPRKEDHA